MTKNAIRLAVGKQLLGETAMQLSASGMNTPLQS